MSVNIKGKYINTALLFFMCSGTLVFTLLLNVPLKKIIFYCIGSLFYFLFLKTNSYSFRGKCDYIQSGEGLFATLLIILYSGFLNISVFQLIFLIFITISVFEFFMIRIMNLKGSESVLNGLFINIIASAAAALLFLKYNIIDKSLLYNSISGFMHINVPSYAGMAVLFIITFVLMFVLYKINPELKLFSHGSKYFSLTGLSYRTIRIALIFTRSFLLSMTVLIIGLTGGIGYYYNPEGSGRVGQLEVLMFTVLYTQFILILCEVLNKNIVIIFSLMFTYLIYILSNKNMAYRYDKN